MDEILCICCNRERKIWAKNMCKSCYYIKKYNNKEYKSHYIPTGKPRGSKGKEKDEINNIIRLREKGKTFAEIGLLVNLSRQRVQKIYSTYK